MAVGRQLFFKHGYGATTMSDVADGAHCSKTTLYARYPSKAALFQAIVSEQVARWDSGAHQTPLPDFATLEETLLAYGEVLMRAASTAEFLQLNRLLYSESGRFPELAEIARARPRLGIDYLAGHIRRLALHENTPCSDPEAAAGLFLTMIRGWSAALIMGDQILPAAARRAWLEDAVRMFIGGRSSW